jgi:hypothetical protein
MAIIRLCAVPSTWVVHSKISKNQPDVDWLRTITCHSQALTLSLNVRHSDRSSIMCDSTTRPQPCPDGSCVSRSHDVLSYAMYIPSRQIQMQMVV